MSMAFVMEVGGYRFSSVQRLTRILPSLVAAKTQGVALQHARH
ncbi:hypothetical protein QFZ94_007021 [Paraburkholderia sp. JPY465]